MLISCVKLDHVLYSINYDTSSYVQCSIVLKVGRSGIMGEN